MKYTVIWRPTAENGLTEIWIDSNDRNTITIAVAELDRQLSTEPYAAGESRDHDHERIVFVPPLACSVQILEQDRRVYVDKVWLTAR